jgi:hypothetical protein
VASDSITASGLVSAVHAALARVEATAEEDSPVERAYPADRIRWAAALYDGGDRDGAADEMMALVDGHLPSEFATVGPRILTGDRAKEAAAFAGGDKQQYGMRGISGAPRDRAVTEGFARLVAGDREAEDALLRTVLVVWPGETHGPRASHRAVRISAVLAVLAEAHADEPQHLDHWAALLGEDDRPRLAAAAALLVPLGIGEVERRCGTIDDVDGEPLVAAFAAAGRFDDAIALAVRLGARAQQHALLRLAAPDLPPAHVKALVAAFRKCPKGGRERDVQMTYQHRFARLLLTFGQVDDAVTVLSRMRDCRISTYGPGPLAFEILRWLHERTKEATPQRLRAVLDVLAEPRVIPQELAAVVTEAIRLSHALADEPLRAEIVDVHVPRLRARLWRTDRLMVDAGLAAALVATGDRTAADALYPKAVGPHADWPLSRVLARLAPHAGLPKRDPATFVGLLATALTCPKPSAEQMLPRLDADGWAAMPDVLALLPDPYVGLVAAAIADFAERAGNLDLLAVALDAAPDAKVALQVARRAATALARGGELADATAVARVCGLAAPDPVPAV